MLARGSPAMRVRTALFSESKTACEVLRPCRAPVFSGALAIGQLTERGPSVRSLWPSSCPCPCPLLGKKVTSTRGIARHKQSSVSETPKTRSMSTWFHQDSRPTPPKRKVRAETVISSWATKYVQRRHLDFERMINQKVRRGVYICRFQVNGEQLGRPTLPMLPTATTTTGHLSAAKQRNLEHGLGAGRRSRCQQRRERFAEELDLLYPPAGPHQVNFRNVLAIVQGLAPVLHCVHHCVHRKPKTSNGGLRKHERKRYVQGTCTCGWRTCSSGEPALFET